MMGVMFGSKTLQMNAEPNGNSRSQHMWLEQRRMEAVMVEILLIGVLVVLAFLCLAGPGGETGSRHRR
jgi:hypothetical protein